MASKMLRPACGGIGASMVPVALRAPIPIKVAPPKYELPGDVTVPVAVSAPRPVSVAPPEKPGELIVPEAASVPDPVRLAPPMWMIVPLDEKEPSPTSAAPPEYDLGGTETTPDAESVLVP